MPYRLEGLQRLSEENRFQDQWEPIGETCKTKKECAEIFRAHASKCNRDSSLTSYRAYRRVTTTKNGDVININNQPPMYL